ncbi:MAG: ABC transporter ATP-binding protein [Paludibacteraceae bacterium]|nr:ABC transporter ATP-binding protein [Paludibacteraceae bacterium]
MSTAIKFENISKQYRLGLVSTGTIRHDLNRWWQINIRGKEDPYLKIGEENDRAHKGESEYVWALKDIDFEVEQGEVLGIIGKNGAGKSTLLKMLSKVTSPTTGTISAKGRIASLLEVGTGFHPEMTGRENIYMNGSIMGMRKSEITSKLDEIVDFAGVERYLDTPVKRYSSGMTVRLGFAIAAHLDPEILVVDEVLAVGDAEFQKKAIGKMQDVSKEQGRTVLFVSHNMGNIVTLCNKGIILSNGKMIFNGSIDKAVDLYISEGNQSSEYIGNNIHQSCFFKKIYFSNAKGNNVSVFDYKESVMINFEIKINQLVNDGTLSFTLIDSKLRPLFTSHQKLKIFDGRMTAIIPAEFLLPGTYFVRSVMHVPNQCFLDTCNNDISFSIEDTGNQYTIYNRADLGIINANIQWKE